MNDAALFEAFEAGAVRMPAPFLNLGRGEESHWSEKFGDIDSYDWFDKNWLAGNVGPLAFFPNPLTQGYFQILSPHAHEKMTKYPDGMPKKFCTLLQRYENGEIASVYAVRGGRTNEQHHTIRAHREVLDALDVDEEVGHGNDWGLDNRNDSEYFVNLTLVDRSLNIMNTRRTRTVNTGLPPGVELRGKDKDGRQQYGWVRWERTPGARVQDKTTGLYKQAPAKGIRSVEVWTDRAVAHQKYLEEKERLALEKRERIALARSMWVRTPKLKHFPQFPPRMRRAKALDLEDLVQTILERNREAEEMATIPF